MSSNEILQSVRQRLATLAEWIGSRTNHDKVGDKHLDADSVERLYWHMGYYNALKDIERLHDQQVSDNTGMESGIQRAARDARNCH